MEGTGALAGYGGSRRVETETRRSPVLAQGSSLLPSSLDVAGSAKSRPRRPLVATGTVSVGGAPAG